MREARDRARRRSAARRRRAPPVSKSGHGPRQRTLPSGARRLPTPFWLDRPRPDDAAAGRRRRGRPGDRRRRLHRPVGRLLAKRERPGPRGRAPGGRDRRLGRQRAQRRVRRLLADPRAPERRLAASPRELEALEAAGRANLAELKADLERHRDRRRLEENGLLSVATQPHELADLDEEAALLRRFGWDAEVLDRDAVRAAVASPTYLGAVLQRTGVGLVDPGALALGLRRAALGLGVRLYERTPVACGHAEADDPRRDGARRRILLATGAYPPLTRAIRRLVAPVYDYVLVTEPLTAAAARRDRLGGAARGSPTAATASTTTASPRTTGCCSAATRRSTTSATGSARSSTGAPRDFALLHEHLLATFPALEGIASRTPGAARSTPAAASA